MYGFVVGLHVTSQSLETLFETRATRKERSVRQQVVVYGLFRMVKGSGLYIAADCCIRYLHTR